MEVWKKKKMLYIGFSLPICTHWATSGLWTQGHFNMWTVSEPGLEPSTLWSSIRSPLYQLSHKRGNFNWKVSLVMAFHPSRGHHCRVSEPLRKMTWLHLLLTLKRREAKRRELFTGFWTMEQRLWEGWCCGCRGSHRWRGESTSSTLTCLNKLLSCHKCRPQ